MEHQTRNDTDAMLIANYDDEVERLKTRIAELEDEIMDLSYQLYECRDEIGG